MPVINHLIRMVGLYILLCTWVATAAAQVEIHDGIVIRQAWIVGLIWFAMTELFELGIGRWISQLTWEQLLHAYDVASGQIWVFVPLWLLMGPYVFFRFVQKPRSAD